MQVRRGLVFWGLFLIALGAVPLLVKAGAIDAPTAARAWRLWPVVLIALGLALVAGRSRGATLGVAVLALVLGLAAGGVLAAGIGGFAFLGNCSDHNSSTTPLDQTGSFAGPATVRLDMSCGDFQLATQAGSDWVLHADYRRSPPIVTAAPDRLAISSPSNASPRQSWALKAPTGALRALEINGAAGSGTVDLAGAALSTVTASADAFDLSINAGAATVGRIDVTVNAGRSRITLGSGPVTGSLSVNAGALDLCVPTGSSLKLHLTDQLTFATNLADRGLVKGGSGTWTRTGSDAESLIDLSIDGAAASFNLDPQGACR